MTPSALVAGGRREARWTRDNIIEKIREWVALYGEPPRAADWNPSAAKWSGATWRVERYQAGDWPSLNAAKRMFDGSLSNAIRAAGFEANKPGPPARRKAAAPEVDVGRLEMHPLARVALDAARQALKELERKLDTRDRQLDRAAAANTALREALAVARREHRPKSPPATPRTITKTKVVRERVEDTRVVKRLEGKLERAERALAEALEGASDTTKAVAEARQAATRAVSRSERAEAKVTEVRAERAEAVRLRKAAEDALAVAERELATPKVEIREVEIRSANDQDVADARDLVAAAQVAAHESELRAARFEREYRELAVVATGEERRLTAAELADLRVKGPSGPAVLQRAVVELTKTMKNGNRTARYAALSKVASAAIRWRDAL